MPSRIERIEGALIGLLVGDALGVPYEFRASKDIPSLAEIEMEPPRGFERAHPSASIGAWSDDGAQALCLLESLLYTGSFDVDDFARRLVNWLDWGHLAVDGFVFDVGVQTSIALGEISRGVPVLDAAPDGESTNGNGSSMRVLPLALHRGTDEELVRDARLSSRPTHPHIRSQLVWALACLYARAMLDEHDAPWDHAVERLRTVVADDSEALHSSRPKSDSMHQHVAEAPATWWTVSTLLGSRSQRDRTKTPFALRSCSATIPTPLRASQEALPVCAMASTRFRRGGALRLEEARSFCRCSPT
jgi:ADP-ribosylglycohydrolase